MAPFVFPRGRQIRDTLYSDVLPLYTRFFFLLTYFTDYGNMNDTLAGDATGLFTELVENKLGWGRKGKMGTYSGIFPFTDWLLGLKYSIPNDLHHSLVDFQIELRRGEGKGRIHGLTSA